MRRIHFAFGILLLAMMVSCNRKNAVKAPAQAENQSLPQPGLSIKMSMSGAPAEIASIVGILSRPGHDTLKCDFLIANDSATGAFSGIATGRWHLGVKAHDQTQLIRYSEETDVDVHGGVTTPISLTLNPATGSIAVTVKWGNLIRSNKALEFDGDSGYVEVLDSPSLTDVESAITLEAWVKSGDTRPYNYLVCKGMSSLEYSMELVNSPLHPAFHLNELQMDFSGASEYWGRLVLENRLSVGTWTHLALAYQDGKGLSVYINGTLALHTNSSGMLSQVAGNLRMGVLLNETYQLFFKGLIDEVRVWNVARTSDQIAKNMRRELVGTEAGLVGYWSFNDSSGATTIRDGSPYRNNGVLRGGVRFTRDTPF
jgi:hypothetical protein